MADFIKFLEPQNGCNRFQFAGKTFTYKENDMHEIGFTAEYGFERFLHAEVEAIDEEGYHYIVMMKRGESVWLPLNIEPMRPIYSETPVKDKFYGTIFQKNKNFGKPIRWERMAREELNYFGGGA